MDVGAPFIRAANEWARVVLAQLSGDRIGLFVVLPPAHDEIFGTGFPVFKTVGITDNGTRAVLFIFGSASTLSCHFNTASIEDHKQGIALIALRLPLDNNLVLAVSCEVQEI